MIKVYVALAVLALSSFGGWHYSTVIDERDAYKKSSEDNAKALEKAGKEQERVQVIEDTFQETKEVIVYVDKIVTKKVVEYRYLNPNRCTLDANWVRIVNEAATGVPGDKGSVGIDGAGPGSTESGVDSADVLEVVSNNYKQYKICQAKVKSLQEILLPYTKKAP